MKNSFHISIATFFKYTYILLLIINFVLLYFYYQFINKNIIDTLNFTYSDESELSSDIDMEEFDRILINIEKKSQGDDTKKIKNIFN